MAPRSQVSGWSADEALELLYAAHWRRLVRLAVLLVRDVGTAEEIVQECFVAVHGRWNRLEDPDKALAYLRQSVVNRSRSHLRHLAVVRRHVDREQPPEPAAAADLATYDHDRRETVLAALGTLAASPARGAGPALLPRSLRGGDRRHPGDQPRRGEEPRLAWRRRLAHPARRGPRGVSMNDDQLRQLLRDAVSDVEPDDRIEELRASVRPGVPVVRVFHARPWYAAAAIVAAVICLVAYVVNVASNNSAEPGYAGQPDGSSGPPTVIATDTAAADPSSSPSGDTHEYAVYYVGKDPHEKPVLFRELHGGAEATSAGQLAQEGLQTTPLDPDYSHHVACGGSPGREAAHGDRTHHGEPGLRLPAAPAGRHVAGVRPGRGPAGRVHAPGGVPHPPPGAVHDARGAGSATCSAFPPPDPSTRTGCWTRCRTSASRPPTRAIRCRATRCASPG